MKGKEYLRTMKKGAKKIENQGKNWYKMLQNVQMTDFGDKIDKFKVILSLELKTIETKMFFSAEREDQLDEVEYKKLGDPTG